MMKKYSNHYRKLIIVMAISILMSILCVVPVSAAGRIHVRYSYTTFNHPSISHDSNGQYYISYYNYTTRDVYFDEGTSLDTALYRGLSYAPSQSAISGTWKETYMDCPDANNMDIRYETKFSGSHIAFVICDASKSYYSNGMKYLSYADAEIIEQHVNSGQRISIPNSTSRFHNIRVADGIESNYSSGLSNGFNSFISKESRYHVIVLEGEPGPITVKAKSMKLNITSKRMSLGESFYLTPVLTPAGASNVMSWSSSNNSVVTVDAFGLVTCVGPGNAKITAVTTDGSNKRATCSITGPKPPSSVTVSGTKNIEYGGTVQLYATIKPLNAVNQTVTWSVEKGNGTVDSNGLVTCTGAGDIRVQAVTSNGKKGTITIKGPKAPSSVRILGLKNIWLWQQIQLSAVVLPSNAINKEVTWSVVSGNGTVDPNTGVVACTGAGNIKVQAITSNGKKGTITITGPKVPSGVKVTGEKNIELGGTVQLSATVKPDNAVNKEVTWSIEKGNGTVDPVTGLVTCTGAGDIRVRASTYNGRKGTITIKGPKEPSSVKVTGEKNITLGGKVQLSATISPANAIHKEVTWSVEKGNGTVDPKTGLVTCTGAGDIRVRASTANGRKGTITIKGPKEPSSVKVTGEKNITLGGTVQLSATISPANAIHREVTWSVEKGNGTVDPKTGLVTCTGTGDIKVAAVTANGRKGSLIIKGPREATSVSIKKSSYTLSVGESCQPIATVSPNGVIYSNVAWTSEKPEIATVAEDGTITAVAPGRTTIYATAYNGKQGRCTVTVK